MSEPAPSANGLKSLQSPTRVGWTTGPPCGIPATQRRRVCLIVESGTDARLVDGLSAFCDVTILARRIEGGVEISQSPNVPVEVVLGGPSRARFACFVFGYLLSRRATFDFVLVQGYAAAALAANAASRLGGTPTAMLVCSPLEAYYRTRRITPAPGKAFRHRGLWSLQAAARLNALLGRQYIVLSEYLAGVVRGHRTRAQIAVIPVYGVDTNVFRPPDAPTAVLRARLGLPATGALIFFSSRVAPEKDSATLLSAFRRLVDTGRDLRLLHRSGGYRQFLREAARFGVEARVIATDAVHPHRELPLSYGACDLCVQASWEEGLGYSPLEALACGVPVVAAAVGGLRETIVDGRTGWSYPPGDAAALATWIADALDHAEEAARRAAAGRDLVVSKYDARLAFARLAQLMAETRSDTATGELVREASGRSGT